MFFTVWYYTPDAGLRNRLALVYSSDQALRWTKSDVLDVTKLHMTRFTPFVIEPYERLVHSTGGKFFLDADCLRGFTGLTGDWLRPALKTSQAEMEPVGKSFCGDLLSVQFPK